MLNNYKELTTLIEEINENIEKYATEDGRKIKKNNEEINKSQRENEEQSEGNISFRQVVNNLDIPVNVTFTKTKRGKPRSKIDKGTDTRKSHTREDKDLLRIKILRFFFSFIYEIFDSYYSPLFNQKIKKVNGRYLKNITRKKLAELFKKKICDLFELDVSSKYRKTDLSNKDAIQNLKEKMPQIEELLTTKIIDAYNFMFIKGEKISRKI